MLVQPHLSKLSGNLKIAAGFKSWGCCLRSTHLFARRLDCFCNIIESRSPGLATPGYQPVKLSEKGKNDSLIRFVFSDRTTSIFRCDLTDISAIFRPS